MVLSRGKNSLLRHFIYTGITGWFTVDVTTTRDNIHLNELSLSFGEVNETVFNIISN